MTRAKSTNSILADPACATTESTPPVAKPKIWIDLDNTPHVPLFAPIIEVLEKRRYPVVLTIRDCFQVRELADQYRLNYQVIGRHSGKNKIRKVAGLLYRAMQLLPTVMKEHPDMAVSVCSRSQLIASALSGLPCLFMGDYEFAKCWAFVRPTWMLCPQVIPDSAFRLDSARILKYPGIKEDIYVPRFTPDPSIRSGLGFTNRDVVVTIRPPASEAHYHNPESDVLFAAAVDFLRQFDDVKLLALPRNEKQAIALRKRWGDLLSGGVMRIPGHAVNGLNLMWHSDFVISGGGTMNREAAALGVPVYSVFRGKIGAVDRYLASEGRLVLLESVGDVRTKIVVARRTPPQAPERQPDALARHIVDLIVALLEAKPLHQPHTGPGEQRV